MIHIVKDKSTLSEIFILPIRSPTSQFVTYIHHLKIASLQATARPLRFNEPKFYQTPSTIEARYFQLYFQNTKVSLQIGKLYLQAYGNATFMQVVCMQKNHRILSRGFSEIVPYVRARKASVCECISQFIHAACFEFSLR